MEKGQQTGAAEGVVRVFVPETGGARAPQPRYDGPARNDERPAQVASGPRPPPAPPPL